MAIAGLITAAATSATVLVHRTFSASKRRVQQSVDARITLEHMLGPIRKAGGGLVRPWQAVSTSCDDDPNHALPPCSPLRGRLHVLQTATAGQGLIGSISGNTVNVSVIGACPINADLGYVTGVRVALVPPESKLATLGATWRTAQCTPLTSGCGCTLTNLNRPGYNPVTSDGAPVSNTDLVGGVITLAAIESYYIDPGNNALMVLSDLEGSGTAVSTALIPKAVAFEARYGYDVDDNGVLDLPLRTTPLPGGASSLRALRLGIALSTGAVAGQTIDAPFFDTRVSVPNAMVLSAEGTATMRATAVFQ